MASANGSKRRTLFATSPCLLLFCRPRRREAHGGLLRTLRERWQRPRRASPPPAAAARAARLWRAMHAPRRVSRTQPSGAERAEWRSDSEPGDVDRRGAPHKRLRSVTMALAAALGGLSLGGASLSSRATLGCTDGLRVRLQCNGRLCCRLLRLTRRAPAGAGHAGAGGAAAHCHDGGSAGACRHAGRLALSRACRHATSSRGAPPRFASRAWAASSRRSTAWW